MIARLEGTGVTYTDDRLKKALPRLSQKSVDDALAAVGRSELPMIDIIRAIAPELEVERTAAYRPKNRQDRAQGEEGWFNLGKVMGLKFRLAGGADGNIRPGGVPIRGLRNDVPVTFEEGGAVPGDRIVGVLLPGEGIRIFQIHSPRLREYEKQGWIDVTWDVSPEKPERFPARLKVTAINEPGTLAQIAQIIGEADGNIDNLRMMRRASDFTDMLLEVEVWDLEHLNRIIAGLRAKPVVSGVERSFD